MDADDLAVIRQLFTQFDERLTSKIEAECWKILPKLDKAVREKLGWRRCDPQDDLQRFSSFVQWMEDVYLRPSLGMDDSTWSDSGSEYGSDDAFASSSSDEEEDARREQERGRQQSKQASLLTGKTMEGKSQSR